MACLRLPSTPGAAESSVIPAAAGLASRDNAELSLLY